MSKDRLYGEPPKKGSREWVRNEKIINQTPALKQMRDNAEGFKSKPGQTHGGKGSAPRTDINSQQYQDNWERIFGKKKGP